MTETSVGRLPTAEEEHRFWTLVEDAWAALGSEPAQLRRALLTRDPETGSGISRESGNNRAGWPS